MNTNDIKKALNDKFVGTEVDIYTAYDISCEFVNILENNGYLRDVNIEKNINRNVVALGLAIRYGGNVLSVPLCTIEYKKKKSGVSHIYGRATTVYEVSEVNLSLGFDGNFDDAYANAYEELKSALDSRSSYVLKAFEIYKELAAKIGGNTYDVRRLCDYISDHYYEFKARAEEESR